MALTATQEAKVRYYLGWSARFHQSDSRLEMALSALPSEAESETLIVAALVRVEDIDTKLTDAHGRLKAMKVGSIDLPGHREVETLRSEGRRWVGRIASTLGVEVRQDVFSGALPNGFADPAGLSSGGNYGMHG
jgi:hypothetical protein